MLELVVLTFVCVPLPIRTTERGTIKDSSQAGTCQLASLEVLLLSLSLAVGTGCTSAYHQL